MESHPRPHVPKLGPDYRFDWVFVSKPILTATIDDTTFNTLQNIPGNNGVEYGKTAKTYRNFRKRFAG